MHGLWMPGGKGHNPERSRQMLKLRDLLRSIVQEHDRVAVCGDFNVLPEDPTISMLEAEFDLRELVSERVRRGEETSTRTSLYFDNPRKRPTNGYADYMFVSDAAMVNKFEIIAEPEVSDHRPLAVDFE
jgi:endonuclease/exonuclease/phosphatase family metal-dependent hydrolase